MVRGLTWRIARLDLLVGQQGVVDALALEIAVAHDFGAAEHLGVEREGAIHVLHGEPEVLHALQPRAERCVVAAFRDGVRVWVAGVLG